MCPAPHRRGPPPLSCHHQPLHHTRTPQQAAAARQHLPNISVTTPHPRRQLAGADIQEDVWGAGGQLVQAGHPDKERHRGRPRVRMGAGDVRSMRRGSSLAAARGAAPGAGSAAGRGRLAGRAHPWQAGPPGPPHPYTSAAPSADVSCTCAAPVLPMYRLQVRVQHRGRHHPGQAGAPPAARGDAAAAALGHQADLGGL